ncbi:DUF5431 family protein [Yokenella regensburgei]
MPHTVDIHIPDPEIALRDSVKGRATGGRCRASLRIQ